jgi:hypothetical protein
MSFLNVRQSWQTLPDVMPPKPGAVIRAADPEKFAIRY